MQTEDNQVSLSSVDNTWGKYSEQGPVNIKKPLLCPAKANTEEHVSVFGCVGDFFLPFLFVCFIPLSLEARQATGKHTEVPAAISSLGSKQ